MAQQGQEKGIAPSIDVKNLSYAFPDGSSGLQDVFVNLPPGSRTLLIGGLLAWMACLIIIKANIK
jgi:CCR4-NOT complex subunit CAF16